MIEVKKYIDADEIPRESIKILLEVAEKLTKKSKKVSRLCDDALCSESNIIPEEVVNLLHIFRTELYKADLSVSEVQKLFQAVEEEEHDENDSEP